MKSLSVSRLHSSPAPRSSPHHSFTLLLDVKLCPTMMALSPAWEDGRERGRADGGVSTVGLKSEENIGGNFGNRDAPR